MRLIGRFIVLIAGVSLIQWADDAPHWALRLTFMVLGVLTMRWWAVDGERAQ